MFSGRLTCEKLSVLTSRLQDFMTARCENPQNPKIPLNLPLPCAPTACPPHVRGAITIAINRRGGKFVLLTIK